MATLWGSSSNCPSLVGINTVKNRPTVERVNKQKGNMPLQKQAGHNTACRVQGCASVAENSVGHM